jgi:UDP-N-acetylmuramate--alanine ligase
MNYFLVGIGGIGMSALAQLLQAKGHTVLGSDRDHSPTTDLLERKGISVTFGHAAIDATVDALVYSDAVPEDNPERASAQTMNIPQYSYFQMLGQISTDYATVAVAGTHGKTTTTGMLAKILVDQDASPTAVIGSIVRDFESNFVAGTSNLFVVEACEYKNHLLNLVSPHVLVITNLELDHTDFFKDLEQLQDTFKRAIESVPADGCIVTDISNKNIAPLLQYARAKVVDYTREVVPTLHLPGTFNEDNARAALVAAREIVPTLSLEKAHASLALFKGSWRRFEFKGHTKEGVIVYDDYAHHPTAVEKTIVAAREKFADKKIVVAFHPHLYSRTKRFADEFARALSFADHVVLAPIYPAREVFDPTISSDILAEKIKALGTPVVVGHNLEEVGSILTSYFLNLTSHDVPVVITMGAGDIYKVAEALTHE